MSDICFMGACHCEKCGNTWSPEKIKSLEQKLRVARAALQKILNLPIVKVEEDVEDFESKKSAWIAGYEEGLVACREIAQEFLEQTK